MNIKLQHFILFLFAVCSPSLFADGFVCRARSEALAIAIFNSSDAPATSAPETMVFADPRIGFERQNIARFTLDNETLRLRGSQFIGQMKPEIVQAGRSGGEISGIKLSQIKEVRLSVDFSYARPVPEGDEVEATLFVVKQNSQEKTLDMECLRYLKDDD